MKNINYYKSLLYLNYIFVVIIIISFMDVIAQIYYYK